MSHIILLKLRYGDAASVLRFIKGAGAMSQTRLSEQMTARQFLPHIKSDLEFELMVRHSRAYPTLGVQTENATSTPMGRVVESRLWLETLSQGPPPAIKSDESGLSSPSESGDSGMLIIEGSPAAELSSVTRPAKQQKLEGGSMLHTEAETGPDAPATYSDPRLADLNISFWTNVLVSNKFAAGAISLYLETDHPLLGLFDANLFVSSLVDCNSKFCSPFLVCSLLAYATVSTIYITPPPERAGCSSQQNLVNQDPSKATTRKIRLLSPKATTLSAKPKSSAMLKSTNQMIRCPRWLGLLCYG